MKSTRRTTCQSLFSTILLLIVLPGPVVYAQNGGLMSQQPIIHGEINDLKVMAQGDAVAFLLPEKKEPLLNDESCAHDLYCAMQKNKMEIVVLKPEGVWLFDRLLKNNAIATIIFDPMYPASSETALQSTTLTPVQIPFELPQPAPTLNTGLALIEETPALFNINSTVMTWLAESVTTISYYRQLSSQGATLDSIIEPTSTALSSVMLTTIAEESNELLMSLSSSTPVPTPTMVDVTQTEDGTIYLETKIEALTIRPSTTQQYGRESEKANTFSFTVKQAPRNTGDSKKEGTTGVAEASESVAFPSTVFPEETNSATSAIQMSSKSDRKVSSAGASDKPIELQMAAMALDSKKYTYICLDETCDKLFISWKDARLHMISRHGISKPNLKKSHARYITLYPSKPVDPNDPFKGKLLTPAPPSESQLIEKARQYTARYGIQRTLDELRKTYGNFQFTYFGFGTFDEFSKKHHL